MLESLFFAGIVNKNTKNLPSNIDEKNAKLNPNFVTGLSDAEASFGVYLVRNSNLKIGWTVDLHFEIELSSKDLALLNQIHAFFGGRNN